MRVCLCGCDRGTHRAHTGQRSEHTADTEAGMTTASSSGVPLLSSLSSAATGTTLCVITTTTVAARAARQVDDGMVYTGATKAFGGGRSVRSALKTILTTSHIHRVKQPQHDLLRKTPFQQGDDKSTANIPTVGVDAGVTIVFCAATRHPLLCSDTLWSVSYGECGAREQWPRPFLPIKTRYKRGRWWEAHLATYMTETAITHY